MKSIPNLDTNNVIPVYGNNATGYLEPPTDLQREKGVIPLDSLPADWWNWLWNNTTKNLNSACLDISALYSEIIAVLTAAGISPQENSTSELKNAIVALTRVVATSTNPGAIKSGSGAGQVSINAEGLGTVNCLGSPTSLATTNKTIVGAINELNTALGTLTGTTLPNTYAPISHASAATTYGVASASQYGHIKVTTGNGLSISNGVLSMGNAVISTTTYPGACCTGTVTAVCYNGTKYNPTSGVVNLGNAVISTTTYPGACCTGTVTAVCYNGTKYNPTSGVVNLGNAVISTTTYPGACCTGTVTAVCYNGTKYNPTSGVVNLGNAPTGFPGYYTGNGTAPGTARAGTSTLVSRGDHVHPFPWVSSCSIGIGLNAATTSNACYSVAVGYCARACNLYDIAIGRESFSQCGCGTAIGYCACARYANVTVVGACSNSMGCNGTALGFSAKAETYGVAVGGYACSRGCYSTALGYASGSKSSTSCYHTAIGACAFANTIIPVNIGNWMFGVDIGNMDGMAECTVYKCFEQVLGNAYERITGGYFGSSSLNLSAPLLGVNTNYDTAGAGYLDISPSGICAYVRGASTTKALFQARKTCTSNVSIQYGMTSSRMFFILPSDIPEPK